jgi:MFS transporter, MHS family, shikimate and dehydroshikimate transport protein
MSIASGRDLRRVVFASVIGAAIEWYDFFLYGVVAGIVFNKLFFPAGDAFVSTLLAYTAFAIGFVARPVGGVLFGHFGDRIGRKAMLVLTLLMMGVATIAIGLLPTYQHIGVAAPIILILLRVVQGVGLGGEWGGAVLMAYEYAPAGQRGFYASLPQIGLAIGLCLASSVVALMSYLPEAEFLSWGWRVGFLASFVLVAIALYIRLRILDTPEFAEIKAQGAQARFPFFAMLREYKVNILLGMGARFIDGVFFNVFAVFSIAYLTMTVKAPKGVALWAISLAALAMVVFIPFFGWLSDRFGRGRTYAMGALTLAISVYPAFLAFGSGDETSIYLAMIASLGIVYSICYGPEAGLFADLFDARVRYTGISFVYQFSGIFASGLTPIAATYLLQAGGGKPWWLCGYVAFAGIVSAVCATAIQLRAEQKARQSARPVSGALVAAE